jgi:O-antigen/teichoic acid export membrane protein
LIKSLFKIYLRNKFIISAGIAERIYFFISFLILARIFSAEEYGRIITIFSIANIFIIFFDLGIPAFLQRETASGKKNHQENFSNAFILNILSFPFYFMAVFFYCKWFFSEISLFITITVSIIVFVFFLCNTAGRALSGLGLFENVFYSLFISRAVSLAAFLAVLFFSAAEVFSILIFILLSALIQLYILLHSAAKNNLILSASNFNFNESLNIIKSSVPLGLAVIFNFLYDKIDILLISTILNFKEAAFYNIGYGVFRTSAVAFSFIFVSGYSRVSYIHKNKKALKLFFLKNIHALSLICMIIFPLMYFFSDQIIRLIYTGKYSGASDVLKILSFATFGIAFNNLTGIILNGLGFFKKNMLITLIGLIINVILNLIFIPVYGITAAAVITIVTEYFIFITGYLIIYKFLK